SLPLSLFFLPGFLFTCCGQFYFTKNFRTGKFLRTKVCYHWCCFFFSFFPFANFCNWFFYYFFRLFAFLSRFFFWFGLRNNRFFHRFFNFCKRFFYWFIIFNRRLFNRSFWLFS